ncbi:MAG: hypothetical protein U1F43_22830 [Myxococcota bacterium]
MRTSLGIIAIAWLPTVLGACFEADHTSDALTSLDADAVADGLGDASATADATVAEVAPDATATGDADATTVADVDPDATIDPDAVADTTTDPDATADTTTDPDATADTTTDPDAVVDPDALADTTDPDATVAPDGDDAGACTPNLAPPWSRKVTRAGGIVVFDELAPAADAGLAWIELHNLMALDVDVSGWNVGGDVSFVFPPGTLVPAGGRLLLAADPARLAAAGIPRPASPASSARSARGRAACPRALRTSRCTTPPTA